MSVATFVINFRRIIVDEDLDGMAVDGVRNRDLLHAVVALYDQSLPDVTTDIIYSHVCRAASRSLLFIRDKEGTLQEMMEKHAKQQNRDKQETDVLNGEATAEDVLAQASGGGEVEEDGKDEAVLDDEESSGEEPGIFDDVYSDTESSEDSIESSDTEEDFSAGSKDFIAAVKHRRSLRNAGKFGDDCVGIESRLAGAASFERLVGKDELGVVQLSLIAVRKRYRRRGLGKRLINMIKDSSVISNFSCIIAYVDHGALKFFRKHGFTDDIIISSKFKHVSEHWENSTFMCYLPPYSDLITESSGKTAQDVAAFCMLDTDISEWRQMHLAAHQKQVVLIERMKHELLDMAVKIRTQELALSQLRAQVDELSQEKQHLAKELNDYRSQSHASFRSAVSSVAERFLGLALPTTEDDSTEEDSSEGVRNKSQ